MCLDTVTKTWKRPLNATKEGVGYKVFVLKGYRRRSQLMFPYFHGSMWKQTKGNESGSADYVPFNVWLKSSSTKKRIKCGSRTYEPAFHILETLKDARAYAGDGGADYRRFCRVKYRKVVAIGAQLVDVDKFRNCIVAREIKVLRTLDGRKRGKTK